VKCYSLSDLVSQGNWYQSNRYVTIYSASNPASYYSSGGVEIALGRNIVQGGNYVTVQNLDLRYGGFHGIQFDGKTNVTVADCDISFIGGIYSGSSRLGNAVEFYASVSNILVEGCNIWEVYDSGITNQYYGTGAVSQHDIVYRNNVIGDCEFPIEVVSSSAMAMYNILCEQNTCLYAGCGWTMYQKDRTSYGTNLEVCQINQNVSNFIIRNNVFYDTNAGLNYITFSGDSWAPGLTIDYNLYYYSGWRYAWSWIYAGAQYTNQDYATYRQYTGQDAHSILAEAQFVDPANRDFHLLSTSPAVDAGTNTGVAADYAGTARPQGPAYDMGAYEYVYTPPTVTINQASGQADPVKSGPINFTVVFSEPVTDFATGDVTVGGTASGTLVGTVTGSGTTYNVAVSGMSGEGTVIPGIAVGKAHDAAGNSNTASTSSDNTVIYDPTPVTVQSSVVNGANGGGVQRSMVNSLVVTFSETVTLDLGAFAVQNRTTGAQVALAVSTQIVGGKTAAILTFSGGQTQYGSLADGNYQLTIDGGKVHDSDTGTNLDGDANGSFGGNKVFGAAAADKFFRLFGDSDGDRYVSNADLKAFQSSYTRAAYQWYFDMQGDGYSDNWDLKQFQLRYGSQLLWS
jgi:hypothetical protein